jgi:glutathione peroxidase
MSAHDFEFISIDGKSIELSEFSGKPVLVVNTASECGLTPQYSQLQALSEKYAARGLVVLGVPCNDFGGQEPGTEADIKSFCSTKYKVTFPMTSKCQVVGENAHPFYKWANEQAGSASVPKWNFHKYLIDGTGQLSGVFESKVSPTDAEVTAAIESELNK